MASSRRQARSTRAIPISGIPDRHYWRARFSTRRYGEVLISFRGDAAHRVSYQPDPDVEGVAWVAKHWEPERFNKLISDPEVSRGLNRYLTTKSYADLT